MSAKTADLAWLRNDRKSFTSIEEDAAIRRVAASWVFTSYHARSDRHGILASTGAESRPRVAGVTAPSWSRRRRAASERDAVSVTRPFRGGMVCSWRR